MSAKGSILVIDDEQEIRESLAQLLKLEGYKADSAATESTTASSTWFCSTSICPTATASICSSTSRATAPRSA
jgi:CheY-like chemotaxis protein